MPAKPFDIKETVISDLESPEDNPRGYGAAAAGTAICGILLIPAATLFYSRLRVVRRKLALVGAALFAVGLSAAIAIGFLAPFTRDYTPLHIQLASAAFFGICSGTLVCSIIAAIPALEAGDSWGPRAACFCSWSIFTSRRTSSTTKCCLPASASGSGCCARTARLRCGS